MLVRGICASKIVLGKNGGTIVSMKKNKAQ